METKDTKMAIFGRARRKRGDYFMYRVCSILLLFGGLLAFSTFSAANNKSSESFGIYLDQSEYSNRIRRSSPIENGTSSPLDESETEEKNCSEPAYKEFPTDGLTSQQRSSGAIVIHILLSLYMFLGLAIICDDYFVASLEQIVEKLQLSDDVAGATFMAAGSSAPELFTSVIGVFVAKGDVGIGTIVGSAVFNILVIIGLCALLCDKPTQLSWWPLLRDSSYYLISIAILIVVMIDSEVFWYEALIMLIFYIGYIMIMKFNTTLQGIVLKLSCCKKKEETPEKIKLGENGTSEVNQTLMPKGIKVDINGPNGETVATVDEVAGMKYAAKDEMATVGMRMMISNNFAPKTRLRMASRLLIMERKNILAARETTTAHGETERVLMKETSRVSTPITSKPDEQCEAGGDDDEDESYVHPFQPPKGDFGTFMKWFISWPLLFLMFITIPNCNNPKFEKFFIVTFVMSTVWIAAFSYVMVWMVCMIGFTLGIPDTIMGITFLAAGTSVPDTIASVMVARNGYGDMAVSNSIGSNVFDILLGLGLPWFLSTTIRPNGGEPTVKINSNGLMLSVSLLLISLIVVVLSIHLNGWKLTKKLGVIIMLSYASFLVLSILIETNVFFQVNLPTCRH